MKTFISIIIVGLGIFCLSVYKPPSMYQHKTLDNIMGDGILQSLEDEKNSDCGYFSVSPGTMHDNVEFKENGKVYVQLSNSRQTFDITELQQLHRLCNFKKKLCRWQNE
jgi:hypothetical protein